MAEEDAQRSGIKQTEFQEAENVSVTAKKVLDIMRGWVGRKESDGSHKPIIDIYNAYRPLARGYALRYTDSWNPSQMA